MAKRSENRLEKDQKARAAAAEHAMIAAIAARANALNTPEGRAKEARVRAHSLSFIRDISDVESRARREYRYMRYSG